MLDVAERTGEALAALGSHALAVPQYQFAWQGHNMRGGGGARDAERAGAKMAESMWKAGAREEAVATYEKVTESIRQASDAGGSRAAANSRFALPPSCQPT